MYRMKNNLYKIRNIIFVAFSLLFLCSAESPIPRILIIGDSIPIGYTPYVKKAFNEKLTTSLEDYCKKHCGFDSNFTKTNVTLIFATTTVVLSDKVDRFPTDVDNYYLRRDGSSKKKNSNLNRT